MLVGYGFDGGSDGLSYGFRWMGRRWVGMGLLCWSLKLLWLGVMSVSMMAMTRSEFGLTAMTMTTMKMVGLESGLTWIMKVLGLEVGAGESVEAVGLWLRWWWWWGFQFGVSGLWVCFELCFGLWMKMVVV